MNEKEVYSIKKIYCTVCFVNFRTCSLKNTFML